MLSDHTRPHIDYPDFPGWHITAHTVSPERELTLTLDEKTGRVTIREGLDWVLTFGEPFDLQVLAKDLLHVAREMEARCRT